MSTLAQFLRWRENPKGWGFCDRFSYNKKCKISLFVVFSEILILFSTHDHYKLNLKYLIHQNVRTISFDGEGICAVISHIPVSSLFLSFSVSVLIVTCDKKNLKLVSISNHGIWNSWANFKEQFTRQGLVNSSLKLAHLFHIHGMKWKLF